MSKRKNTEINAYIPIPEGQNDLLDDMKSIMYDEDIDFNLIAIDQDKDSKMELIYLNDDLKDVPILSITISTYKLMQEMSKVRVEEYFSKLGYAVNGTSLITPNKQYFTISHSEELCFVEFLNAGSYTQEEVNKFREQIKILADNIYNNPKDFPSNYFDEIAKEDKYINMTYKTEGDKTYYQMVHKNEAITEWVEHKKEIDWTEFIKELHTEYKNNLQK